uniref:Per os infectivity factor 1 n=1 Tax=Lymantria dispar multicapsid nuclear polyhedrosis virus TaxID=10449 RepID=A0A1B1MR27_NPVLD|nr:per os infectivity factor 1 [Lymantria dispar multiple nucleopolyhedrovirus]
MWSSWWLLFAIALLLVAIVAAVGAFVTLLARHDEAVAPPLFRFDNRDVPLIDPPAEIVIEGNPHECHAQLTPCASHADCDLCREGLANCQYFAERTILQMQNGEEFVLEPNTSYCLALNRERARSCNPNTGVWLLAETEIGFSLLCSCLTPGLVTQLNLYGDCDVAVGCQPNGRIVDLNESPLRCECDAGFVAEFNEETQTPFCRARLVRDVIYDLDFFHRAPCRAGFVRVDHPALDDQYRREFRLNDICVLDPCSVDPITGFRINGTLQYFEEEESGRRFSYCNCNLVDNVFGVFSASGNAMLGESSAFATNACIQPFGATITSVTRVDYKRFWARDQSAFSDDEIVAATRPVSLQQRYRSIAYPFLTQHPFVNEAALSMCVLFKFSVAHTPLFVPSSTSPHRLYRNLEQRIGQCLHPGVGRCIVANPDDCIRRHGSVQVGFAETFTNQTCYLSREGFHILVWRAAVDYSRTPAVFNMNALGLLGNSTRDNRNLYIVFTNNFALTQPEHLNLKRVLDTFPQYSIN